MSDIIEIRGATRLHKLAANASSLAVFVSEVLRFPGWFLTPDQKRFTKQDLRTFYETIKGGK